MEPTTTQIRVERDGEIAILTMEGPSKRNALARQSRGDLLSAVRHLMHDEPDVKGIVLTGAAGHFCAGADVTQFSKSSILGGRFNVNETGETVHEICAGPKPMVAAVEGTAYGMGLSLAVACDFLVASREARMCAVFARIGLVPDTGIFWTLPRKVGVPLSREMLSLAREVRGDEALELGLADEVVEPGQALEAAKALCRELATLPAMSIALTKVALTHHSASFDDALRAEIYCQPILRQTPEHHEAVRAHAASIRAKAET